MENRQGPVVDAKVTQATGKAEREAVAELVDALGESQRITLGADKNYDTKSFADDMHKMNCISSDQNWHSVVEKERITGFDWGVNQFVKWQYKST